MADLTLIQLMLSLTLIISVIIYILNVYKFKNEKISIAIPFVVVFVEIMSTIISVNLGKIPILTIAVIILWLPHLYNSIKKILNKK